MARDAFLIVAGEASGDLHAARLLQALRQLRPDLAAFGMGGGELEAAGFDLVAASSEISVVGITEVLGILRRARQIFHQLLAEVDRRGTRVAILVDFPDFNLRLAKALEARGVRVIYYVSPQVWAWRQGRVKTIARVVDRMLVLFPFEVDFYHGHGVPALHVGHPLVDEVPVLPQVWDRGPAEEPFHVALLPGSRRSEVAVLLPILVQAAQCLAGRVRARFSLIRAPSIPVETVERALSDSDLEVEVVSRGRYPRIASCHLALCAAGTATLEVGLLGTPMVVVHKVAWPSYWLARLLVRLPHASLVNLILQRGVVPELLQGEARPETICRAALDLLSDHDAIRRLRGALADLRERIGPPGASRRAAEEILRLAGPAEAPAPEPRGPQSAG